MVVTAWPSARNAGIRQLCTGSPSSSTVQAPQSPASQPFLTPKWPSSRRNVRRHCPARGALRKLLAVDLEAHGQQALQFGADFLGEPQRHVLAPGRLAMDVVVIEVVGDALQDRVAQFARRRALPAKRQSNGPRGRCRHRQRQMRRRCRRCRSTAPPSGRPASARSGETPSAASARRAGVSICRSRSPGASTLRWLPVTKSATRNLLLAAVGLPDRADAVERRGQRDHRPGRQRHAEIAADGRGLPDLEGGEKGAAALVDQRRGEPFRRAGQRVELRDRAGRGDREPGLGDGQRRPFQIGEIDQPASGAPAAPRTARCRPRAKHRLPSKRAIAPALPDARPR